MATHRINHSLGVPLVVRATERHETTPTRAKRVHTRKQAYIVYKVGDERINRHGCAKPGTGWNREFPPEYWTTYIK